jgi:carbamoyltransferase
VTDPLYILGIHDGHNCGATLTRDGKVVASICEERLTRRKNEVGYPRRSIDEALRIGGIAAADLSEIVFASLFMHAPAYLTELEKWYCVGLAEQRAAEAAPKDYQKVVFETRKRERFETASAHLGVSADRVFFVEHHLAHLAAAYYTAPNAAPGKAILGLTNDGAGDGICGTVSICRGNDIKRLAAIDRHASLGKIYSRVTMLMGMTPWEHEYKIMGLAPYADPKRAGRAAEALRGLIRLSADGLTFEQVGELSTNYCYEYLRDSFERVRFDVVAAATQLFTEEMLVEWVRACIARTGVRDLVAGGGVFMNVKANMLIAALPEVDSFYVMPSASDESLSIGAALHRYYQTTGIVDHGESVLTDLYLGGEFDAANEAAAIAGAIGGSGARVVQPNDMNRAIANLLADGEIVAVCRGRMEWGARALGNRSILASAEDTRRIDRINRMIKMRDFWMPFAPSIRAESAARYFDDPKNLKPWFMTMAFEARPEGYADLAAGSHPRDRTIRPQVVTRTANPAYHAVLGHFEERTGRGAVLNTSFNLHGEPIVYAPADAIRVLLNSGLDHLALGHHLISKSAPTGA